MSAFVARFTSPDIRVRDITWQIFIHGSEIPKYKDYGCLVRKSVVKQVHEETDSL